MSTTTETGSSTLADIDAIIAIANAVDGSTTADVDQSTDQVLSQVDIDVDAILAEINGAPAASSEEPKPARKRGGKKSTDAAAAVPPAVVIAATASAETTPSPALAVKDPIAFGILLTDTDRAAYDTRFEGAAKKVKEKAENAVAALTTGKKLSRFTSMAVKALIATGEVTSADLVKVYTDAGLVVGTARAQSQQMTSLFRMFGLVSQDGRSFKIANQQLADKLAAVAA